MLEDIEFRLRVKVDSDSPEAVILNYLNSKQTLYPARDMAMIALMSYWLPIAYEANGLQAREKMKRAIRASIYRLKLHLQDLQQMLGEEVEPGKEMALFEAKQLTNRLEIQSHAVTTGDSSSDKSEIEHTKSEGANAESRAWFNPLKSSPKLSAH